MTQTATALLQFEERPARVITNLRTGSMPETVARFNVTAIPARVHNLHPLGRFESQKRPISIDALYGAQLNGVKHPLDALNGLSRAISILELAKDRLPYDLMGSDEQIQNFQIILPDLFRFRHIGDGYGLVINSTQIALINLHGRLLEKPQIIAMLRGFRTLRETPFLSFDRALDIVEELETVGLQVDPQPLGELFETDESIR